MVFNAAHNKRSGRAAVAHVIEVRIHTDNGAVIGDIVSRIRGVGVLSRSRRHLIDNTGHLPRGTVIVIVVCVNAYIAARHIGFCDVINDLLIVGGHRHLYLLGYTGSQDRRAA